METLYFIDGPLDDTTLDYETVPEKITVPCFPMVPFYNPHSEQEELTYQQAVYQRIASTNNYICVSYPK